MIWYVLIVLVGFIIYREIRLADKEYDARIDLMKFEADLRQVGEDMKMERLIEMEAQRLFSEWKSCVDYYNEGEYRFFSFLPSIPGYCIHSGIAKYENTNIYVLISNRFDELVKNHKI
jgi:hypothetical protein